MISASALLTFVQMKFLFCQVSFRAWFHFLFTHHFKNLFSLVFLLDIQLNILNDEKILNGNVLFFSSLYHYRFWHSLPTPDRHSSLLCSRGTSYYRFTCVSDHSIYDSTNRFNFLLIKAMFVEAPPRLLSSPIFLVPANRTLKELQQNCLLDQSRTSRSQRITLQIFEYSYHLSFPRQNSAVLYIS